LIKDYASIFCAASEWNFNTFLAAVVTLKPDDDAPSAKKDEIIQILNPACPLECETDSTGI
jgi:hypothetical protein